MYPPPYDGFPQKPLEWPAYVTSERDRLRRELDVERDKVRLLERHLKRSKQQTNQAIRTNGDLRTEISDLRKELEDLKNKPAPTYTEYSANNSGGDWWLTYEDWQALEKDGWKVFWVKDLRYTWTPEGNYLYDTDGLPLLLPRDSKEHIPSRYHFLYPLRDDGTYMGTHAKCAWYLGSIASAIASFERVTSANPRDLGCKCCGPPHNFTEYKDGEISRCVSPEDPTQGALNL